MTYKLLFKTKLLTTDTRLTRPPNTKQWRLFRRLASADYNIIHIVISTIIICSVLSHTYPWTVVIYGRVAIHYFIKPSRWYLITSRRREAVYVQHPAD